MTPERRTADRSSGKHCGKREQHMQQRTTRTRLGFGGIAVAALAASVVAALATAPKVLATNCPPPPSIVHPFLPWGDSRDYVPVTNGNFEPIVKGSQVSPWALSGPASIVSD